MILKKKINQFSDEIIDIEVLDKDVIREKINNLDLLDIKLEVMDIALDLVGECDNAYAVLDITTGEVVYGWTDKGEIEECPNIYIDIIKQKDVDMYRDKAEVLLNYEDLEMFNMLTGEWIKMDYTDALDYVIDRFNIDVDKRLRDFCMTDGLDYMEVNGNMLYDLEIIYIDK